MTCLGGDVGDETALRRWMQHQASTLNQLRKAALAQDRLSGDQDHGLAGIADEPRRHLVALCRNAAWWRRLGHLGPARGRADGVSDAVNRNCPRRCGFVPSKVIQVELQPQKPAKDWPTEQVGAHAYGGHRRRLDPASTILGTPQRDLPSGVRQDGAILRSRMRT